MEASPSLADYAGLYAADGGVIEVRATATGLDVLAHGAPVAARLRGLALSDARVDAHAERLLDAWVAGDLAPVVAAVRPDRQPDAAEALDRYRRALVRGHGPAVASSVAGTFRAPQGVSITLVQILFERGSEWASLVWDEDGHLVTLTRGLSPVVVGTLRPTSRDAFAGADVRARFERNVDGRVETLRMGDRLVAVR